MMAVGAIANAFGVEQAAGARVETDAHGNAGEASERGTAKRALRMEGGGNRAGLAVGARSQ